jgi:hypothetical protein
MANGSWVDHPVYVAGVSVAGTIAICIALYKEVLLPAQMAASDYKVSELERQLKDVKAQKLIAEQVAEKNIVTSSSEKRQLSDELKSVKAMLEKTKLEFSSFKLGNLFFEGGVYPSSFDKVKIGQPISIVEKVFAGTLIKKEDGFVNLDVDHPVFGSVVYYYSDEAPQNIYQVMYMTRSGFGESVEANYLQAQLAKAFGEPIQIAEDKFYWKVKGKFNIFKDDDSFLITTGDNLPGGWDRIVRKYWKSIDVQKETTK